MSTPVNPTRVRYIKLGAAGGWETTCIERGICLIGFGTTQVKRFQLCVSRRWKELPALFRASGRDQGTATRFTNELRAFFEDDGSTLWITFIGERLYWGFFDSSKPVQDQKLNGVRRRIRGGWQNTDLHGEPLTKDRLSGSLTKIAAYRGTSCDVKGERDYVIRRINGKKIPAVERALAASQTLKASVLDLIRLLGPKDFELLVDLVFSTSGWRRVGVLGKTQKTLDLDMVLPSTGERAFVQVKSKTSPRELAEYVERISDGPYTRMFYVFHSGAANMKIPDPRVIIVGPEQLSELVMDAGLVSWLVRKVS